MSRKTKTNAELFRTRQEWGKSADEIEYDLERVAELVAEELDRQKAYCFGPRNSWIGELR